MEFLRLVFIRIFGIEKKMYEKEVDELEKTIVDLRSYIRVIHQYTGMNSYKEEKVEEDDYRLRKISSLCVDAEEKFGSKLKDLVPANINKQN